MTKKRSNKKNLPVEYPSVPDIETDPTQYNEPEIPTGIDRVPAGQFQLGDTKADLRLQIEQLLQRKEVVSADAWAQLGPGARTLLVELLEEAAAGSRKEDLDRLITVMGLLSLKRSIVQLSAILTDRSTRPVTRAYAANALGRIGETAAVKALVIASKAKDDMIRRQVAIALGRIEQEAVIPHLLELREDESIAVAEAASEAVRRWEERLEKQLGEQRTPPRTESKVGTTYAEKAHPAEEN